MVLKVQPWHLNKMKKDIDREKKNTKLCMNPFITPEQERVATKAREGQGLRPDQILFKMRKARIEGTVMAPTYVEDQIKHMMHNVKWENPNGTGA